MFLAKPTIYKTQQSRVTYAASWLTGAAARYYQNLMEREMSDPTLYLESLHEWPHFVARFSQLFGLHDEQMHSQAALDGTIQIGRAHV